MVAPTYICFHAVTLNLNSIFGGVMCDIVTIIVGTDVLGGPQNIEFLIVFGGRPMVAPTYICFHAVGVNLIVYFYGPPRTSVPTIQSKFSALPFICV